MEKINTVSIIGTLVETNLKEGVTKATAERPSSKYINGNIILKVNSAATNSEMLIEVPVFVSELKKDKTVSKVYEALQTIESNKGRRLEVMGGLTENKFYSDRNGAIIKTNKLRMNFFSVLPVGDTREDEAKFSVSGFVVEALKEKNNKNGDLICYELKLGQSDYSEKKADIFTITVDAHNEAAANYIRDNYQKGDTVTLHGHLNYTVETVTVKQEAEFGEPITKTYQNATKQFVCDSGKKELEGYSDEVIATLITGAKEDDAAVLERAKNTASANPSNPAPTQVASTNRNLVL